MELEALKARIVTQAEAERIIGEPVGPLVEAGHLSVITGRAGPAFDVGELHDLLARRRLGLRPAQPNPPILA